MHAIFFKKNKKGIEWQISEMIVFFFGAILLIALVAFFLKLQSALFAEEDDGSIANLKRLNEEIKELLGTSPDQDSKIINYFIGEDKMLLGFDTGATNDFTIIAQSKPGQMMFSSAYRPFKCGDSACLCLYNGVPGTTSPNSDQNVVDCTSGEISGKNIIFSSPGIFPIPNLNPNNRIRQIRIEKNKQGDTYNIDIRSE